MTTKQTLSFLAVTLHVFLWSVILFILTVWAVLSGRVWEYAVGTFKLVAGNTYTGIKEFTLSQVPETLAIIPLLLIVSYASNYLFTFIFRKDFDPRNHKVSRLLFKSSQVSIF